MCLVIEVPPDCRRLPEALKKLRVVLSRYPGPVGVLNKVSSELIDPELSTAMMNAGGITLVMFIGACASSGGGGAAVARYSP